jgi:protein subunit release factor A
MATELKDEDLKIEFFRGSGPGGQHRNVTESGVRIRHLPTGIVVQAAERRSQFQNRELALERLRELLARRERKRKKRIATGVPRGEKERRLEAKKRLGDKKRQRSSVAD